MQIKCRKCSDIIESKHRHDMVWCKCGAIAIDGGNDYCKITGSLDDVIFMDKDGNELPKSVQQVIRLSRYGKNGERGITCKKWEMNDE